MLCTAIVHVSEMIVLSEASPGAGKMEVSLG